MELTKQELTLLINTINESLPDDNDLKGFLGISKALITDVLTESNALLVRLKDYDNRFETIIMKRELAGLFSKINKNLEGKFEKISADKFDSILSDITRIKFLVRETYISVVENQPIRTEAEIAIAKEELDLLKSNIEELKKISIDVTALKDSTINNITEIQTEINTKKDSTVNSINDIHEEAKNLKDSATNIVTDLSEKQNAFTENEKKVQEFLVKIEAHEKAIEKAEENTTQWQKEISEAKEAIATNSAEYNSLTEKSRAIQAEIEATHEKIFGKKDAEGKPIKGYFQETENLKNEMATFLASQQKKFLAQFTEIEGLLPGATSAGLAEAYQIQKISYERPLLIWSTIFILTTTIMTGVSLALIYHQFKSPTQLTFNEALISLLRDLPFFIPTIWLAGYASKQQSQYKRLQQEYAFKETNAKSFHGHKMQIEELMKEGNTDEALLSQLVAQLVMITAQNPSVTLDNKSHEDSSPIIKLLEKYILPNKKEGPKE